VAQVSHIFASQVPLRLLLGKSHSFVQTAPQNLHFDGLVRLLQMKPVPIPGMLNSSQAIRPPQILRPFRFVADRTLFSGRHSDDAAEHPQQPVSDNLLLFVVLALKLGFFLTDGVHLALSISKGSQSLTRTRNPSPPDTGVIARILERSM
jgi:hypothetical protein